ncbi:MAG: hypothetical protein ACOYN0_06770 [Phycisphaerales bacterium]
METTSKVIATAFSLTGFSVAVVAGLGAGNPASSVLLRAILCMIVCNLVGQAVGAVASRTVKAHLDDFRAANPIPDLSTGSQPSSNDASFPGGRSS